MKWQTVNLVALLLILTACSSHRTMRLEKIHAASLAYSLEQMASKSFDIVIDDTIQPADCCTPSATRRRHIVGHQREASQQAAAVRQQDTTSQNQLNEASRSLAPAIPSETTFSLIIVIVLVCLLGVCFRVLRL